MVRGRLVEELQRVTGGRVDLGSFHTIPFRLQVDVRDLTIHGKETPGEIPYVHIDRLVAQVKLISILGAEFGFTSVVFERPIIHVIQYSDGTTNQPESKVRSSDPITRLFDLSISRLEVRRGEFLLNNHKIPLDFAANDISAEMDYSFLRRRYEGSLLLGKVDTRFEDFRPLAWMLETRFSLGQSILEVRSLRATSGRSQIEAAGKFEYVHQPEIEGTYKLSLDLGEAGAIARRQEIRRGVVQVEGKGSWSLEKFASTGRISARNVDWAQPDFNLRNANLNTTFDLTRDLLTLKQIEAKLLGGEVNGDAEVSLWLSPPLGAKLTGKNSPQEQRGALRLRLKGLSAAEIANTLSSPARPLVRGNVLGDVSGTVDTTWQKSARNAETKVVLDIAPAPRTAPHQLPLRGHTDAIYRATSEELEVANLTISTPATQVLASGTMSSRAAMKLSVRTTDLGEWQPVLAALGYEEEVPVTLRGEATLEGNATGKLSAITFAGRLESEDFDFVMPAAKHMPAKQVHWDALSATVQLSPSGFVAHDGVLRHGDATVNFSGGAGLHERQFTDSSPFTARLSVHHGDVEELLAFAGLDYPVTGQIDMAMQASGTKTDPEGSGHMEISQATFRGEPIQHFDSDFHFAGKAVSLEKVHLAYYEARATGGGTYDFSTHTYQFDMTGKDFVLTRLPQFQASRVSVDGRLDFTANGKGTLEEPELNARIQLRELAFDHEVAGGYTLDAVTHGAQLTLSGRSQFKDAELNIDGNVLLRDDWPSDVRLQMSHLDVDSILRRYGKSTVTGHSSAAGDVRIQGPLRRPSELQITGSLTDLYADVEHIKIRNNGPIRFAVANQVLEIQEFRLGGEGTDLSLNGTMQLNAGHQLDLHAKGQANLQLIQNYDPDFATSGTVVVNVAVTGTMARPAFQGRLQISNGSVAYSDLPSQLSDVNGSLVFNQDRLQIETLTAHVGGGLIEFGGYASAYNRQLNFDLSLKGHDVRLRYPPGVSSVTDADLRFSGNSNSSALSGEATVTKLAVTPGFDFAEYLERTAQSSALPQTNPLLNRIRMDVHIVTLPELQMQTASVRLSGDADLHLRGTAAKPVLLGRADVIEGEIYFNGTKYHLERGDVTFTNPVTTKPVLDLQASTHVREYDITVNLNGEFDKLNMTYHSEPPLPSADIISLLALGRTQEESAQLQSTGQSSFTQQASSAALAEALNTAFSNRARSLFGISHIKVDPQGLNTETSPTSSAPAVTIEQQVKDNLTLTYTTNVAQTSQQIIQAEYNITRNVSILGIRDYNGVVSFEIRVRRRKR
jgi:translocation and assembly module TamB